MFPFCRSIIVAVNMKNSKYKGCCALFDAAFRNDLAGCERALRLGDDITMAGSPKMTPLYIACQEGHVGIVRLLLEAGGCDTNKARDDGATPLYIACVEGHVDVVRLLLEAGGCDANKAIDDGGATPLGAALANGQDSCVELLLAAPGINVNFVLRPCQEFAEAGRLRGWHQHVRSPSGLEAGEQPEPCSYHKTPAAVLAIEHAGGRDRRLRADPDKGTRICSLAAAGAAGPVIRREAMVRLVLGAHAMCTRCREYGYCCDADGESIGVCQKKHWKVGGHRAECAALVASSSSQGIAVEASGGDVTGVAEGKGDEMDGETTADTLVSGDGGGTQKKKGGGKKGKKKGRR